MNLIISRALSEHAKSLTEIAISAKRHWNYPEAWIQIWVPTLTMTSEYIQTHETWIAMIEDKPVAYYSFGKNEEELWLDNLWVFPEYMGQGIGKSLFQHVIERCKSLGVSVLKIEADPNAQNFYERMGARKVSEHHTSEHHTKIEDELRILPVMEINL